MAQHIFPYQSCTVKIERDFGSAGQRMSSRKSRVDSFHVEIDPYVSSPSTRSPVKCPCLPDGNRLCVCLPGRFTGKTRSSSEPTPMQTVWVLLFVLKIT